MRQVYFKDDFTVRITLRDNAGQPVAVPPIDFTARLSTPGSPRFVAISRRQGVDQGFTVDADDGVMIVAMDGHGLWPGPLVADFDFRLPDATYPDQSQRLVRHYDLGITLTARPTDIPADAVADTPLPWMLVHDTDIYASVLAKINEHMTAILGTPLLPVVNEYIADILGTSLPTIATATVSTRAKAASTTVQRGMMRTGAMPGMVYDGRVQSFGARVSSQVLFVKISGINARSVGQWVSLERAFPDGKFVMGENSYNIFVQFGVDTEGEYDRENNRVRVTECYSLGPSVTVRIDTTCDYVRYLTTNSTGRIVVAPAAKYSERVLDTNFDVIGFGDGIPVISEYYGHCMGQVHRYGFAIADDNSALELQWYNASQYRNQRSKWHKILNPSKRKCGVFRVRRRSGRYKSEWVYYTTAIICGERRIKRI